MNILEAAEQVLKEVGKPLHPKEITQRMLERHLWETKGLTPHSTIEARIAVDIKEREARSHFQRTGRGIFALREWGLPEYVARTSSKKKPASLANTEVDKSPSVGPPKPKQSISFTDAAEQILEQFDNKKPMHYKAITEKALELGLIITRGQTPDQTMYAQILTEIERTKQRGEIGRFTKHGRGLVGLTEWVDYGLAHQIEQHNNEVRKQLRTRLYAMTPAEFEGLIGALLVRIGFEDVEVTGRSGDGGVDVRGTLVVGGVIRTRMAVQAKRWKNNVQAPIVQQVRGSLGTHEQGLIITTSDFSSGARQEAERPNAVPVALMDGEQLVKLMVEHDLGVHRNPSYLIELSDAGDE